MGSHDAALADTNDHQRIEIQFFLIVLTFEKLLGLFQVIFRDVFDVTPGHFQRIHLGFCAFAVELHTTAAMPSIVQCQHSATCLPQRENKFLVGAGLSSPFMHEQNCLGILSLVRWKVGSTQLHAVFCYQFNSARLLCFVLTGFAILC